MAALSNYPHLCDSPHDPTHPHLCVLPLPLHLSGTQEEADKVIGILLGLKRNFFLQEGWWVGGAGRDIFWPLLGSWQVIHWRQCSRKCGWSHNCVPSKGGCGNPVGRTRMALAWLWAPRSGTPAYPGCQLDHGVRIIHSTFFPLLGWSTTCVLPWSNTCGLLLLGEQSPTFEGGDGSISGGQVSFQGLEISTEDQSSQKPETTVYVSGARDQACVGGVSLHTWNCGLFGRAAQSRANFGEKHCNCCLIYIKLCSGCFPWWCVWSSIWRPQLPSIMEGKEIQLSLSHHKVMQLIDWIFPGEVGLCKGSSSGRCASITCLYWEY